MVKYLLFVILLLVAISMFFGCDFNSILNSNNNVSLEHGTGGPESYHMYGFMEKCSNGDKYITVESFEVSTAYENEEVALNDAGCYIFLGISSNLKSDDFSNQDNLIELWLSPQERIQLNFVSWDFDNRKLVYEISGNETMDYSEILNLSISVSEEIDEYYPVLNMFFDIFNKYCVVDGVQYCGQGVSLKLNC